LHLQDTYGNDQTKVTVTPLPFLRSEGGSFHALYPGTTLLVLAIAGVALAWRPRRSTEPDNDDDDDEDTEGDDAVEPEPSRRVVLFLGTGVLLAFALSLGEHLGIGPLNLYDVIREHVPGYASLRSPFRFAALVQIFLIPLAAIALHRMWRKPDEGGQVI